MHPATKTANLTGDILQNPVQTAHKVENMFAKLKDWRRIATRYDRRADVFMAAITLAAIVIWWLQ